MKKTKKQVLKEAIEKLLRCEYHLPCSFLRLDGHFPKDEIDRLVSCLADIEWVVKEMSPDLADSVWLRSGSPIRVGQIEYPLRMATYLIRSRDFYELGNTLFYYVKPVIEDWRQKLERESRKV